MVADKEPEISSVLVVRNLSNETSQAEVYHHTHTHTPTHQETFLFTKLQLTELFGPAVKYVKLKTDHREPGKCLAIIQFESREVRCFGWFCFCIKKKTETCFRKPVKPRQEMVDLSYTGLKHVYITLKKITLDLEEEAEKRSQSKW